MKRGVTDFLNTLESDSQILFEAEPDIMIVLDAQGNIKRVNPAFERALNRHEHEVLGLPIVALVHIQDMARFIRAFSTESGAGPFRMLRRNSGAVEMVLVAFKFRRVNDNQGRRGFLILRPMRLVNE